MPESLGLTLKKARESKHLSIEEVSERTRIPRNIISIIEEDKINEIKSHFYAKSFVKTYSNFLGASEEPAVKEFLSAEKASQKKPASAFAAGIKPKEQKIVINEIKRLNLSSISRYKTQIIAVIAAIIIFWILSFAVGQFVRFAKNMHKAKQNTRTVIKNQAPKKIEKKKDARKSASEALKPLPAKETDSVELEVSALGDTWLKIVVDNELLFTGLFKKGSKDTWKAKKEIRLEAGNAGDIRISVNGKTMGAPGKSGEKKEIIVTKDGIK
jgi:cytoskeletal protein RodZ